MNYTISIEELEQINNVIDWIILYWDDIAQDTDYHQEDIKILSKIYDKIYVIKEHRKISNYNDLIIIKK